MTNLQLYLAVGLPIIAVVSSLIISLVQISAIREEMRENLREIRVDLREIRVDIKLITGKLAELDGRVGALEVTMNARFDAAHQNLLRVEQVFDARLKHLEEDR